MKAMKRFVTSAALLLDVGFSQSKRLSSCRHANHQIAKDAHQFPTRSLSNRKRKHAAKPIQQARSAFLKNPALSPTFTKARQSPKKVGTTPKKTSRGQTPLSVASRSATLKKAEVTPASKKVELGSRGSRIEGIKRRERKNLRKRRHRKRFLVKRRRDRKSSRGRKHKRHSSKKPSWPTVFLSSSQQSWNPVPETVLCALLLRKNEAVSSTAPTSSAASLDNSLRAEEPQQEQPVQDKEQPVQDQGQGQTPEQEQQQGEQPGAKQRQEPSGQTLASLCAYSSTNHHLNSTQKNLVTCSTTKQPAGSVSPQNSFNQQRIQGTQSSGQGTQIGQKQAPVFGDVSAKLSPFDENKEMTFELAQKLKEAGQLQPHIDGWIEYTVEYTVKLTEVASNLSCLAEIGWNQNDLAAMYQRQEAVNTMLGKPENFHTEALKRGIGSLEMIIRADPDVPTTKTKTLIISEAKDALTQFEGTRAKLERVKETLDEQIRCAEETQGTDSFGEPELQSTETAIRLANEIQSFLFKMFVMLEHDIPSAAAKLEVRESEIESFWQRLKSAADVEAWLKSREDELAKIDGLPKPRPGTRQEVAFELAMKRAFQKIEEVRILHKCESTRWALDIPHLAKPKIQ